MALDRDKFIADAKAAGYTDKEIEAEVGPSSAAVAPPSSADQAAAKNDAEFAAGKEKMKADYDAKNKANSMAGMSDVKFGDFETQIPTFFTTPVGLVTAGAAAYGALTGAKKAGETGVEGLKKVYGSLRDFSKEKFGDDGLLANQQAQKSAVEDLATSTPKEATATQKPTTNVDTSTDVGKGFKTEEKNLVAKSEQNKNLTQAAKEAGASDVRKFTRDASGNIQWEKGMSPSGRAGAEAFMQQFPDLAKQLEAKGQFAILGAGSGDNSLYNSYGAQTRKDIIQQVNQGNLAGPHGGNEGFYNKTLTPAINAVPPTTPLGAELARLRVEQPNGGTHGQLGTSAAVKPGGTGLVIGKNQLPGALKAGGTAALLMAIANAANASTKPQESSVGNSVPPPSADGAFVGYPQLVAQGKKIQKAGEARIPENIADPRTYGFVKGLVTGDTESSGMSVLSPSHAKAKEAAYYGGQLSNLLQMIAK